MMNENDKKEFFALMDSLYLAFYNEKMDQSFWDRKKQLYFDYLSQDFSLEKIREKITHMIRAKNHFPQVYDFYDLQYWYAYNRTHKNTIEY
jgi:hypothetical protein